jgi:hypothetical protein
MDAAVSRHPVDSRPPSGRLAVLGIQHVLIMYTGCVTVPLVFGAAAAWRNTGSGCRRTDLRAAARIRPRVRPAHRVTTR